MRNCEKLSSSIGMFTSFNNNRNSRRTGTYTLTFVNYIVLFVLLTIISSECLGKKIEIIAHRGAPNLAPEHTFRSYGIAIENGADYVELDIMPTKDNILVVTHSFELSEITNVADLPQFADRKKTIVVENLGKHTGWFVQDFTFNEIQILRVHERYPFRNQLFNGLYTMPSLEQTIQFVQGISQYTKQSYKLYIETKHPTFFEKVVGLDVHQTFVNILKKHNYVSLTMFQSFESSSLKTIKELLDKDSLKGIGYVQLITPNRIQNDTGLPFSEYLTNEGLDKLMTYATGVGPNAVMVTKQWVEECHKRNIVVHPWTLRSDPYFLNGTTFDEVLFQFLDYGIDGIFTEDIIATKAGIALYLDEFDEVKFIVASSSVIVGLFVIGGIIAAVFFYYRHKNRRYAFQEEETELSKEPAYPKGYF
ncbi:hypothetical protein ABK040_002649 [Willaertia magna]